MEADEGAEPDESAGTTPPRHSRRTGRRQRASTAQPSRLPPLLRTWGIPAGAGVVLALVSWTTTPANLKPTDIIDFDYRGAIEWAAVHHVAFGNRLTFTYGPLGFLAWPTLFFAAPAALGFAFLTGLQAATGAVIYRFFRRCTPLPAAILLSYLVSAIVASGFAVDFVVPLALVWAAALATREAARRVTVGWIAAGGFTAVAGLIKVSMGPPVLLIFVLAWLLRRDRVIGDGAAYLAGLVFGFVIIWTATGNSLAATFTWVRLSASFVTGYSAMAYELDGRLYFYWLAGLSVVVVLGCALVKGFDRGGAWSALGWVVMAAIGLESAFRESFVRHDAHDVLFFAELPLFLAAVATPSIRRLFRLQPTFVVTAAVLELAVVGAAPSILARPVTGVHNWLSTARAIASTSERNQLEGSARAGLQAIYRLPASWLTRLAGQPVTAVPRGQPMAWTYPQLRWDPLPTIQEYTAYTPSLDQLDAHFLASPKGPVWVLQQAFGLDGRDPVWDSPAAEVALTCNFQPVGTSPFLTLARRIPDACGPEQRVAEIRTSTGRTVDLPAAPARSGLVASITVGPSLLGRMAGLAFKGATYSVVVNGTTTYRYVAGTGSSPHLLSFPLYRGTTMAVATIHTLKVVSNDPWASAPEVTITVSALPVR